MVKLLIINLFLIQNIFQKIIKALNTVQREYYDSIMEIKEEIEMLLPPTYRDIYKAPQIRKGTVERLMKW